MTNLPSVQTEMLPDKSIGIECFCGEPHSGVQIYEEMVSKKKKIKNLLCFGCIAQSMKCNLRRPLQDIKRPIEYCIFNDGIFSSTGKLAG